MVHGAGSGEYNESRFLRKYAGDGHAGNGHRRRAVGNKDFLRHVIRQEAGVAQEASGRRGSRRTHHFRGGGSFLFLIACEDIRARSWFSLRTAFGSRSRRISARHETIDCTPSMHFRIFLLIAALFLIGLEAIYQLYQLASFVL